MGGAIPHREVEQISAVELVPEVIEAVRWLSKYNYNALDDSKVSVHIDDARHYLLTNDQQFDVIVSDLFVPWQSESGYLYTVDHYEVALKRLKPDGLFCQWLPLYQLGQREFEMIADSFATVFPNTTLWMAQLETTSPVIALVGTRSDLQVDSGQLASRLQRLNQELTSPDQSIATPERFWDHYVGDWPLRSSATLNTDEHPRVEFLTPISNRDGKMIRGKVLAEYFEEVLFHLPMEQVEMIGVHSMDSKRRREKQRLILFGE